MKLLIEQIHEYDVLYEAVNDKKHLVLEGVFLQSNIKNKNGRIYPPDVMANEVARYTKEKINKRNSFGELDHPPTPQVNLKNVSHLVTSLKRDGDNYIGRARILETPQGLTVKALIEGGGQLAVSSRGVGSIRNTGGVMEVQSDFRLSTCADIVSDPSAPQAYVNAIMESSEWVFDQAKNQWVAQSVLDEIHNSKPSQIDEEQALELFKKWLSSF